MTERNCALQRVRVVLPFGPQNDPLTSRYLDRSPPSVILSDEGGRGIKCLSHA
jgi:hypothetical protein